MLRTLLTCAFTSLPLLQPSVASAQKPSASVVGLEIERVKPENFGAGPAPVRIALAVLVPGKTIIGLADGSQLQSLKDDKNSDLTRDFPTRGNTFSGLVSKDADGILVQIHARNAPDPGATKLLLKATIAVLIGTEEKTSEAKDLAFKENAMGTADNIRVSVVKNSGNGLQIACATTSRNIKRVAFTDENGKEIKSRGAGLASSVGAGPEYRYFFVLEGKPAKFNVKVTYYGKVETIQVPVEAELGLGL